MQEQAPCRQAQQQVFSPPPHKPNGPSRDPVFEIRWHRPAQTAISHNQPADFDELQMGLYAASSGLYFRKFWHGISPQSRYNRTRTA